MSVVNQLDSTNAAMYSSYILSIQIEGTEGINDGIVMESAERGAIALLQNAGTNGIDTFHLTSSKWETIKQDLKNSAVATAVRAEYDSTIEELIGFQKFYTSDKKDPYILAAFQPTWDMDVTVPSSSYIPAELQGEKINFDGYPRFGA